LNLVNDLSHAFKYLSHGWNTRPSKRTKDDVFRAWAQRGFERGVAAKRAQNAYYPGAETGRFRNDWLTTICTSTNLLRRSYKTLAARSEYAYRTDPYARRAVEILKTFTVGSGLRPFPSVKLVQSGEPIEAINKKLSDDWERFNDEGMRIGSQNITMYEAQGVEFITMVTLGSVLRQTIKSRPGSWLPFSFNIIKPYRLDFSHDNFYDDIQYKNFLAKGEQLTVLGQVLNSYAEPTAFWIDGEEVPRSADNMSIHYRQIEAEQYLGVPWLTPSLGNIWDVQQLFEDKLIQSRLLTRMGVWEKKGNKGAMSLLEETIDDTDESCPFDKQQIYYADDKPEPIQFDDTMETAFHPLVKMALHATAIGAGFSYQLLSSDLEGANFAGGRINVITDSKIFNSLYKSFYKSNCQPSWAKFVEWEVLSGKLPGVSYAQYLRDPWYYNQCYWLPEGEQWVDPLKDAQAQRLLYQTGQCTLQQLCAWQGNNYKAIIAQRKREKEELKAAGLEELLPAFTDAGTASLTQPQPQEQNQAGGANG
jgi:lambda family phage portal protein